MVLDPVETPRCAWRRTACYTRHRAGTRDGLRAWTVMWRSSLFRCRGRHLSGPFGQHHQRDSLRSLRSAAPYPMIYLALYLGALLLYRCGSVRGGQGTIRPVSGKGRGRNNLMLPDHSRVGWSHALPRGVEHCGGETSVGRLLNSAAGPVACCFQRHGGGPVAALAGGPGWRGPAPDSNTVRAGLSPWVLAPAGSLDPAPALLGWC